MAPERVQRKLTTILAADVEGYTRLMRADEEATLKTLGEYREITEALIARHDGRIFSTGGDSVLAEFGSAVEAVRCAISWQEEIASRNAEQADDRKLMFRIGINVGDVMTRDDDLFGDGVNVAARLEGLAQPGGVCISGSVFEQVKHKLSLGFEDLGPQKVKNITEPVSAYGLVPGSVSVAAAAKTPSASKTPADQSIHFCTASDGVQIAYATVGSGPPLVKAPNWMNHLEYDWESPIWRHLVGDLSEDYTLVRFDQRGNGLSDWDVPEFTFDVMVDDLAMVIDAAGLERVSLLGISQGCSFSIAYAVRYPERVRKLVLYGGFARGRNRRGKAGQQSYELSRQMILTGWGQYNPAFRQFFTSLFIPGATKEQEDWFNELQQMTTSPENAALLLDVFANVDVTEMLSKISVPTLVLHCRDDGIVPFEEGRRMAAGIPGSKFVSMDGQNHLMLEHEPAWPRFLEETRAFLSE